ncbi:serine/threonine-protein kinase ULK3-like isoform X2 [Physella acuta]|uniref:serine/threonine-protein kinase ULK3-like isoform X2 n=1 Tax=Physella acuta TaxID=109671 RepID=UPI0027DE424B|nr:serine/threonine-protein kinase ULK3-like isoform X2 [Physella acuta]
MEYCSGGDLSRFIRSKRALPEHIAKRFLQQIASAMKFLWDNNVAHMDLKPQNILLTSNTSPQIKLADFGFAKHLYDGDRLHVMRGSPLYMAPEIVILGTYDNRVDLWSIGVILYECLFGKAPFASKNFKELGEKIWDQKPIEIPQGCNVSDKARDLTLRLLQRLPAKRITFEEFFAHPFVDMEHIPSKDSLTKASEIVAEAVKKDEERDYKTAVRLYCEALDYFMPAIHYEKSLEKKQVLRSKVQAYMDRAETLKQIMKTELHKPSVKPLRSLSTDSDSRLVTSKGDPPTSSAGTIRSLPPTPPKSQESVQPSAFGALSISVSDPAAITRTMSNNTLDELMTLCADSQELLAVLKLINAALIEEQKDEYEQCLHHYELALGALLKILPSEPKGKRKDLLKSQVTDWMDRAEKIKSYLDIKNLSTQDTTAQEEMSEYDYFSELKQCCIQ